MSNILEVPQQQAIQALIAKDWSVRRIALTLGINRRTVKRSRFPAWHGASRSKLSEEMAEFLEPIGMEMTVAKLEDEDDDLPQSVEEAKADEEDARMQLLLDRVTARMDQFVIPQTFYDQATA